MLYPATPVLSAAMFHVRFICEVETALAVSPVGCAGACTSANCAPAERFVEAIRVQVAESPVHAPLHPAKPEPAAGEAVSVNSLPVITVVLHAVPPFPQLIPPGLLVTVPMPVPATDTVMVFVIGALFTVIAALPDAALAPALSYALAEME